MKREVVRDFLNLPGIVGIALVDGRSRPFFVGIDQTLNFQQKEALAQGIQQVVDTTPSSFDFFEFQFSGYQIYLYKLDQGLILLVLGNRQLAYSSYAPLVARLKIELQSNLVSAIADFRMVAGHVTLSSQNYWKRQANAASSLTQPSLSQEAASPVQEATSVPDSILASDDLAESPVGVSSPPPHPAEPDSLLNGRYPPQPEGDRPPTPIDSFAKSSDSSAEPLTAPAQNPGSAVNRPIDAPSIEAPGETAAFSTADSTSDLSDSLVDSPTAKKSVDAVLNTENSGNTADSAGDSPDSVTLKEVLTALNQFSKLTTRYLGSTLIANYWKSSRPPVEWLSHFDVDRSGQFTATASMPSGSYTLSPEQHQWLREWVSSFIQRCSQVIRDFSRIIQTMELDAHQRTLLMPDP